MVEATGFTAGRGKRKHVVGEEVVYLLAFCILVSTLQRTAIDLSYRPIHFSEFLFFCNPKG